MCPHVLQAKPHKLLPTDYTTAMTNPPDSFCIAACLDHSKGFWATPVPEVKLIVGGDQEELSSRVEGQRCDGNIALCKPTLTTTLKEKRMF